jgi:hypothetical protein
MADTNVKLGSGELVFETEALKRNERRSYSQGFPQLCGKHPSLKVKL